VIIFVIHSVSIFPDEVKVILQFPLTCTAHVPLRSPLSAWKSRPGRFISLGAMDTFKRPKLPATSLRAGLGYRPCFQ